MPTLHLIVLLVILAALAILGGISWVYVLSTLAVVLLIIIAAYGRRP